MPSIAEKLHKAISLDAVQWWQNGDHPDDECRTIMPEDVEDVPGEDRPEALFLSQGKVVSRYRHPQFDGHALCKDCGYILNNHGWIDTPPDGRNVCPGDYIVGLDDGYYPMKPDLYHAL